MLNRTKSRRCRKREAGAFPDLSVLRASESIAKGSIAARRLLRIGMKSNETKAIGGRRVGRVAGSSELCHTNLVAQVMLAGLGGIAAKLAQSRIKAQHGLPATAVTRAKSDAERLRHRIVDAYPMRIMHRHMRAAAGRPPRFTGVIFAR